MLNAVDRFRAGECWRTAAQQPADGFLHVRLEEEADGNRQIEMDDISAIWICGHLLICGRPIRQHEDDLAVRGDGHVKGRRDFYTSEVRLFEPHFASSLLRLALGSLGDGQV